MARIRTIKPQHTQDKFLPQISLQAHLLWVLSWCYSDDEGVFENDPLLIKSNLFPRRTDVRVEQIQTWLDQLVKARFIIPFVYNGTGYYVHRTFKIHQRIDKPQLSIIPLEILNNVIKDNSENVPRMVENSPLCIVKDSKGEVREGDELPPPAPEKQKTKFDFFVDWLQENAPSLLKMQQPFTEIQYEEAKRKYSTDTLKSICMAMDNKPQLLKNYKSAYKTFLNWAKRDEKK